MSGTTTDPNDPRLGRGADTEPTEQHEVYLVLPADSSRPYVRPYRETYVHVGPPGPQHPLSDLTSAEREHYADRHYVKYETYPESESGSAVVGRYWTQSALDRAGQGCRTSTRMSADIAATYARDPKFYGSTYCARCRMHLPVSEFVWEGTNERVGS